MADTKTSIAPSSASAAAPAGQDVREVFMNAQQQILNQYNEHVRTGNTPGAKAAQRQMATLYAQAAMVSENQTLLKDMMKLAPNLTKQIAEEMNAGGIDAFKKMLEAQQEANKKKQDMYMDEVNRMYNSRLATAEGPAKLMASFKGFAILLQSLFGIDCSNFIKECDERIESEYAKIPKKNIEGLSGVNAYTVDPTQATQAMEIMRRKAQEVAREVPGNVRDSTGQSYGAAVNSLGGDTAGTQPQAAVKAEPPVATGLVATAMEQIIAEKKLITGKGNDGLKADLEKRLALAAGSDGDAKTVSAKDVGALAINAQDAIKSHGGSVSAEAAMALTKQAIERARAMAVAGAPSPQPA